MDTSPRVLLWGFSREEQNRIQQFLMELNAPPAVMIERKQGHLKVHDILFTDLRAEDEFASDEKVMLFFNVQADSIKGIMQAFKNMDIPRPIFAMVTQQSIDWKFSYLVEHLVEERDFIQRRRQEEMH